MLNPGDADSTHVFAVRFFLQPERLSDVESTVWAESSTFNQT